jgi:hypothetical protein
MAGHINQCDLQTLHVTSYQCHWRHVNIFPDRTNITCRRLSENHAIKNFWGVQGMDIRVSLHATRPGEAR